MNSWTCRHISNATVFGFASSNRKNHQSPIPGYPNPNRPNLMPCALPDALPLAHFFLRDLPPAMAAFILASLDFCTWAMYHVPSELLRSAIHIFCVQMEILQGCPQIQQSILHQCRFHKKNCSEIWRTEDKLEHVGMVNPSNTTNWFHMHFFGLQIPVHIGDPCNFVGSHCFEARSPCAPRSGFG